MSTSSDSAVRPELNPYDWDFHEDPYPIYRALRDHAPLYRNDALGFWALTRYDDVLRGLKEWETFSNSEGVALEAFSPEIWRVMFFLAMDPPRHDHLRGLVGKAFTPRRVQDVVPGIRALAAHYMDGFVERGRCEFIGDFAGKIPMDVVSEMIGVPAADRDMVRGWADTVMHREPGKVEVPRAGNEASGNLLAYFADLLREHRKNPADDLTEALCQAEVDGDRLTDDEIVSFLFLMSIAGNETTTKLLGNAVYWATRNPDQMEKIRRDPSPERVAGWVEETLRFDASSQILYRTVSRRVEMHGEVMEKGDRVALIIASANRDERMFDDPDRYDIERDCSQSLAFGKGVHFCLGANLARLEARLCLEEFLKRTRDFNVDPSALVRVHSGNVRGFASMQVEFTPA